MILYKSDIVTVEATDGGLMYWNDEQNGGYWCDDTRKNRRLAVEMAELETRCKYERIQDNRRTEYSPQN